MSARRQARAAVAPVEVDGAPPAVLYDANADVWHDRAKFLQFMAAHGWYLPIPERMGHDSSPANRRSRAADAWGMANGVGDASGADWHHLRAMGLIADTTSPASRRGAQKDANA